MTLSLAGRTARPLPQEGAVRSGGFGGAQGLAEWLRAHGVALVIDATHPFAARISANAEEAALLAGIPLVALERPAWEPVAGDHWIAAKDVGEAAALIGRRPRTVFLAIGRQELAPFRGLTQHRFVVRSVDAVAPGEGPAGATYIEARGPFGEAAERDLLAAHGIDIAVAKNSGGDATYGKIAAARSLGIPVVMIERPRGRPAFAVSGVDEAFRSAAHLLALAKRGE